MPSDDTEQNLIESVCRGNARELGLAQGQALREKIHAARESLSQLETFRNRQPRWLPYAIYRWLAERKSRRFVQAAFAGERIEAYQRMEGLAEGAGLPFRAVCLMNALEPVLASVVDSTASPGACSAVAVRGARSATGEPILVRNFDYLPLVQPFYTIRDVRPEVGHRSLEFTTAPLVGAVDGMNDAGLCIAYDYAFPERTPDRPFSAPIRHVSTVDPHRLEPPATFGSRIPSLTPTKAPLGEGPPATFGSRIPSLTPAKAPAIPFSFLRE